MIEIVEIKVFYKNINFSTAYVTLLEYHTLHYDEKKPAEDRVDAKALRYILF